MFRCNRGRTKRLDESMRGLEKYCDSLNIKKKLRSRLMVNGPSRASQPSISGARPQKNSTDSVVQRLDNKAKTNKCARNTEGGMQILGHSLVSGEKKDAPSNNSGNCGPIDKNIPKLPAGGEGPGKKIKKKSSTAAVFARPKDGDGKLTWASRGKFNNAIDLQSSKNNWPRSGYANCVNGTKKHDDSLSCQAASRNETITLELDTKVKKRKVLPKEKNRSSAHEDAYVGGSLLTKKKPSWIPQMSFESTKNASDYLHNAVVSQSLKQSERTISNQPMRGSINSKRTVRTGPSSTPMPKWVGQRPQKISRIRRAHVVSPVSDESEMSLPSEGCPPDLLKDEGILSDQINAWLENMPSSKKSQSKEFSIANSKLTGKKTSTREVVDCKLTEKKTGNREVVDRNTNGVLSSALSLINSRMNSSPLDDNGDGVKRQGESGRGSLASKSPTRQWKELGKPPLPRPGRSMRQNSAEPKSKSARPPWQKESECKMVGCSAHPRVNATNFIESDDDHEELVAAAKAASRGCMDKAGSGPLWTKVERIFGPVDEAATSLLKGGIVLETIPVSHIQSGQSVPNQNGPKEKPTLELAAGLPEAGGGDHLSLYQIVLSSLIIVDETEEPATCNELPSICADYESEKDNAAELDCDSAKQLVDIRQCNEEFSCNDDFMEADFTHELLTLDDRVMLELQAIGLFPEHMPGLAEDYSEKLDKEIAELEKELSQESAKVEGFGKKLYSSCIQERKRKERDVKEDAMDKLVESAYKKHLAVERSAKSGENKASKRSVQGFMRRTIARCQTFEKTGRSCFDEPLLEDIIFGKLRSPDEPGNDTSSVRDRNVILDEVGGATGNSAQPKTGSGRSAENAEAPQRADVIGDGGSRKQDAEATTSCSEGDGGESDLTDLMNLPLNELESVGEVGGGSDLGGHTDLGSWLNLDESELPDDDCFGLEIPMDDLSELNLLL